MLKYLQMATSIQTSETSAKPLLAVRFWILLRGTFQRFCGTLSYQTRRLYGRIRVSVLHRAFVLETPHRDLGEGLRRPVLGGGFRWDLGRLAGFGERHELLLNVVVRRSSLYGGATVLCRLLRPILWLELQPSVQVFYSLLLLQTGEFAMLVKVTLFSRTMESGT